MKDGKKTGTNQGWNYKKTVILICLVIIIALSIFVFFFVGKPLLRWISEPEKFREWVDSHGVYGRLAFLGMTMLQVVIAMIPGEPMEMVAGYAFGSIEGTLLCILGATLGGTIVFWLVRRFGTRAVLVFFSQEKIDSLKFLKSSRKRDKIGRAHV